MRVLITGGAGFIGSHLCDALVAREHQVTILDNFSTGTQKNIAHLIGKIEIIRGDILETELVKGLIQKCDLIIHMAAAVGVDTILADPIQSIKTNFHGSEIVINFALQFKKRILIASTSEIYGKNQNQPLHELSDRIMGAPQKIRWSYADAKALEEAIAHHLFLTRQLQVSTVRFFNTTGPRQSGDYGMVLPRFVKAALRNDPLVIFGDGAQTRVFCHVEDAVKAVLLILQSGKTVGEIFNIGGSYEISILDLARLVIKLLKSKSKIDFAKYEVSYKPGFEDMLRRVPDISKINKYVNWTPEINLEKIILDIAEYQTKEI